MLIFLKKQQGGERNTKCHNKKNKAYITWEENASNTSSDSSNEKEANLCLMTDDEVESAISSSGYRMFCLFVDGLKHNLLRISQLCDKGYKISLNKDCCIISNPIINQIEFVGNWIGNTYMLNIDCVSSSHLTCLTSNDDVSWLWNRWVAHIHMNNLNKLISKELVKGLPKLKFVKGWLV